MEKEIHGITLRSLIFGIIYMVALTFFLQWGGVINHNPDVHMANNPWASWPCCIRSWYHDTAGFFHFVFFWLLVPMLVQWVLPEKFRFKHYELAFIFSLIAMVPFLTDEVSGCGFRFWLQFAYEAQTGRGPLMLECVSPLMFPVDKISDFEPFRYGGLPVDWSIWTVPIAFWLIFFITFRLFFLFGSYLVSGLFIDEENLPFPAACVASDIMDAVAPEKKREGSSGLSKKLMIIGAVIAFVFRLIDQPNVWYPNFPFEFDPGLHLSQYAYINGPLDFTFLIGWFAWALVIPIDAVVSTPIFYVVHYNIIPAIMVAIGLKVAMPTGLALYHAARRYVDFALWDPSPLLKTWSYSTVEGVVIAMAVLPLIFKYKYFARLIRQSMRKGGLERVCLIGWAVTGLGVLVLLSLVSIPIHYGLFLMVIWSITFMAMARGMAEFAAFSGLYHTTMYWQYCFLDNTLPLLGNAGSAAIYNTMIIGYEFLRPAQTQMNSNPMMISLMSLKLGSLKGLNRKDQFLGVVLGNLIPLFIVLPFGLWLGHVFGWNRRTPQWMLQGRDAQWLIELNKTVTGPGMGAEGWALIVAGFLMATSIVLLRRRFSIFRYITPWGFFLAMFIKSRGWFAFLIAAIIRLVSYRVGGAKIYNRIIYPIGVGLILGLVFWYPFDYFVYLLRGLGVTWW